LVTFRRDDQNAEKPTFYDGIQLIQSHLYATTGLSLFEIKQSHTFGLLTLP
jgi:hypothetical protein